MDDMIDITFDEMEQVPSTTTTSSFGSGMELLMNTNIPNKKKMNLDNDLEHLENELNELSVLDYDNTSNDRVKLKGDSVDETFNVHFGTQDSTQTWDGFKKSPIFEPNTPAPQQPPVMSNDDIIKEKFKFLKKLEDLEKKGIELTKKYSMESPLLEMQTEYEVLKDNKARENAVKFQGNMLMTCINGIEYLNGRFDPFDLKLDGWSEQISENITDYDDVFGELYDKYKTKATIAPELRLLFQLGGSAMMVHMTNTMFKSSMPGMDDILRQNPDLMRSFQTAAANSMSQSHPGTSGFMNHILNPSGPSPPPTMTAQEMRSPAPLDRGGNNPFGSLGSMGQSNIPQRQTQSQSPTQTQAQAQSSRARPEMTGPANLSDILSGLKTKTINIQSPQPMTNPPNTPSSTNNNSTISINDIKELQGNLPKRSRRKKGTETNTISLDI